MGDLFLVGKKTAESLAKIGAYTIGGLASCEKNFLVRRFGKMGKQLHLNANGLDDSPIAAIGEGDALKSVGNGYTFKRNLVSGGDIQVAVTYLYDSVATRLRKHNFKCRVVQVAIKDANMKSISRQTTLPAPTHLSRDIADAAIDIITKNWKSGNPIRTLTIAGENLVPACQAESVQLSLFDIPAQAGEPAAPRSERAERLAQTIDRIRERYGSKAVIPGNILGNDIGIQDKYK